MEGNQILQEKGQSGEGEDEGEKQCFFMVRQDRGQSGRKENEGGKLILFVGIT